MPLFSGADWQELLELAQRKFLRQVTQYADAMESSPFPRLFVLDFLSDEEKATLRASDEQKDEKVDQCPLAAAEAAAAAAGDTAQAEVILYFYTATQNKLWCIVEHICNKYEPLCYMTFIINKYQKVGEVK